MADSKQRDVPRHHPDSNQPHQRRPSPAGPHAAPELTDNDKTPGSGVLPEPGDPNVSPTS